MPAEMLRWKETVAEEGQERHGLNVLRGHEGVVFETRDGTKSCTLEGVHLWDPSNPCKQIIN